MSQRTHEIVIPQQTRYEIDTPPLEVGDWAFVTRCLKKQLLVDAGHKVERKDYWSIETFRGLVLRTPESTRDDLHEVRKHNLPSQLPLMPLYHIAQVHLLERDGDFLHEPYSDLTIRPNDQNHHLDHFDLVANMQRREAIEIDLR